MEANKLSLSSQKIIQWRLSNYTIEGLFAALFLLAESPFSLGSFGSLFILGGLRLTSCIVSSISYSA